MPTGLGPLTSAHSLLFLLSLISLAGVFIGVTLVMAGSPGARWC